jgi:hypothetical protein
VECVAHVLERRQAAPFCLFPQRCLVLQRQLASADPLLRHVPRSTQDADDDPAHHVQ